jgi:hypothetical protein
VDQNEVMDELGRTVEYVEELQETVRHLEDKLRRFEQPLEEQTETKEK